MPVQGDTQQAGLPSNVGAPGTWSPAPNPTRRPTLRALAAIGVLTTLFLLGAFVIVSVLGSGLQAQVLVLSVLVAVIPLLIIVPTYLWLDRFEAEPTRLLLFAFGWGALVAAAAAYWLNTASLHWILASGWADPLETGARFVAPVVEESLKGLGILVIFLWRRREFDGIVDGLVYAGLIGAGFAFTENVLYLGRAYTEYGAEGMQATFIVRCLMAPFGHPLFTSFIGIGLGIAVATRSALVRVGAVALGLACAVLLHSMWNSSAVAGGMGFFGAYLTVQVPLFLAFLAFLVWMRRREGRLIGQYLSPYADAGWLTHSEVAMLAHLGTRRAARAWARSTGGRPASRSMAAFQDSASDLALLRSRIVHGTAEADAAQRELALLDAVTAHRRGFVGSPVT